MKKVALSVLLLVSMVMLYSQDAQQELKQSYNGKIAAGSTVLVIGGGMVATSVVYHFVGSYYGVTAEGKAASHKSATIAIGATGGAFMAAGGVLLGFGLHEKCIYNKDKKAVSLNITPQSMGVALTF